MNLIEILEHHGISESDFASQLITMGTAIAGDCRVEMLDGRYRLIMFYDSSGQRIGFKTSMAGNEMVFIRPENIRDAFELVQVVEEMDAVEHVMYVCARSHSDLPQLSEPSLQDSQFLLENLNKLLQQISN